MNPSSSGVAYTDPTTGIVVNNDGSAYDPANGAYLGAQDYTAVVTVGYDGTVYFQDGSSVNMVQALINAEPSLGMTPGVAGSSAQSGYAPLPGQTPLIGPGSSTLFSTPTVSPAGAGVNSLLSTLTSLFSAGTSAYTAAELAQINVQRAAQGLPPISATGSVPMSSSQIITLALIAAGAVLILGAEKKRA